jgi:hypothetical protein
MCACRKINGGITFIIHEFIVHANKYIFFFGDRVHGNLSCTGLVFDTWFLLDPPTLHSPRPSPEPESSYTHIHYHEEFQSCRASSDLAPLCSVCDQGHKPQDIANCFRSLIRGKKFKVI